MLADETARLERLDGCLPRVHLLPGGTAWDDLLFRSLWHCGWEVQFLLDPCESLARAADLVVVAPANSQNPWNLPPVTPPMLVLVASVRRSSIGQLSDRPDVQFMNFEAGIMRIMQQCEAMANATTHRVPTVQFDEWIKS